jgi:hypothetical protein
MVRQSLDVQREFQTLEARLLGYLKEERFYGASEANREGQARVVASFNDLVARIGLETSFTDLCRC